MEDVNEDVSNAKSHVEQVLMFKIRVSIPYKLDEQRFAEAVERNATQAANDSIAPASYNHHSPADELNMVIDGLQSIVIAEARDDKGNSTKDLGEDRNLLVKKEKSSGASAAPIIVPIVLKMAEFDHKALLEEWISTRSFSDNYPLQCIEQGGTSSVSGGSVRVTPQKQITG
ncbi:hypothetical protein AgCh_025758 [Apium graveolens]